MSDIDSMKSVIKLSKYNRYRINKNSTHGCYHCISVIDGEEIVDWTDGGKTAICPRCGVDAILPFVTDTKHLTELCEYWFTGVAKDSADDIIVEPNVLTILEKLNILDTVKNIYNIHYCKAGVGIVFYYPEFHKLLGDWKKGLNCKKYYPTFEDCIAAEYRIAIGESLVEEEPVRSDREYIDGQVSDDKLVNEYMFVTVAENTKTLTKTINKLVSEGWDVDGDIAIAASVTGMKFVQRMRREKTKG